MRLIVSILVGMIFTLFWLLKLEWWYDLWIVNLINIDWTFDVNLSFIKTFADFILYLPEIIINWEKESIREFLDKYIILWDLELYLLVIFLFHFTLSYFIWFFSSIFTWYNVKLYLTIMSVSAYILFIFIFKSLT